jgi:hypothetical protein
VQPETKIRRYRERAEELRQLAQSAKTPETQRELLILAAQWEALADEIAARRS